MKKHSLAAVRPGQVRVEKDHGGCDVVPVHSSQVLWQGEHGGQPLLAQLPVLSGAESVSDEVCGSVGVQRRGGPRLPLQQQFVHLT